ncbi:hypothetical protein [Natronomonas sp. EA1]|uniref:hypothetical protein n=1 Tax=Natronomonas sp. EA1 TaxID=3421655 RepID=UPI003EBF35C3
MHSIPATPALDDTALLDGGHLWILEAVTGAPVRFQVTDVGLVFGDETDEFQPWGEPLPFRAAARQVRDRFDDAAFRAEVDSPDEYTFVGTATRYEGIAYDWDRLPAFLGTDIVRPDGTVLPPDAVDRAFDRLGLTPLPPVEKETPAKHFSAERFGLPDSAWYDGPAAGLLLRNKTGGRARVDGELPQVALAADTDEYARETASRWLDGVISAQDAPTVETVLDRLLERLAREEYARLFEEESPAFDVKAFRSTLSEAVSRRLTP